MSIFRRKVPIHYIPVHPDNIKKKDWIILLEAGTIVGTVAKAVQNGVLEKQPWYPPSEMLPPKPIIDGKMDIDFDKYGC